MQGLALFAEDHWADCPEFQCTLTGECIPYSYVCDGYLDCWGEVQDFSDEDCVGEWDCPE